MKKVALFSHNMVLCYYLKVNCWLLQTNNNQRIERRHICGTQ